MNNLSHKNEVEVLAKELEETMLKLYGSVLLSGAQLQKALDYRSIGALRQAILRGTIPVPLFPMEKRHGKFALIKDVALYLAEQRCSMVRSNT